MKKKIKKRFPIAFKLVGMTLFVLVVISTLITYKSAELFEQVLRDREESANRAQAHAKSIEIEGLVGKYINKAELVARLLLKDFSNPEEKKSSIDLTFSQDPDLVSLSVVNLKNQKPEIFRNIVNESYLKQYHQNEQFLKTLRYSRPLPYNSAFAGSVEIRNSTLGKNSPPLMTILFPFVKDEFGAISHIAVADIRLDRIQQIFSQITERLIYLITSDGKVLAHPKEELALEYRSLHHLSIVDKALNSKLKQEQVPPFLDPRDQLRYIGTFSKAPSGVIVISQAREDVILEPARHVRQQAILITGIVLSITIFFVFIFSISLTSPIEKLFELTKRVAHGQFDAIARTVIKSNDEVGELAEAFDEMTIGLKERDKIKNMFNKFHGSSVTEDLLKGSDVNLGGTNKVVTVFFSDIRDFTKFSEKHTPEEVVDMLNEYFEVMVGIINKNNGIVDKFIGDAIMAIWGAPKSSQNDAALAAQACIEMRTALEQLNIRRMARNESPIKIGMALHSGNAISGTIGSDERMEYTVIGDTVNMASRIEASTKAFGTDLLISEVTANQLKDKFWLELAGSAEVKGKSQPLKMFKVKGYIENGKPIEVKTPYSDYSAEAVDKVKVAS